MEKESIIKKICFLCKYTKNQLAKSRKCKTHKYCFECLSRLEVIGVPVESCSECNKYYEKKSKEESKKNSSHLDCKGNRKKSDVPVIGTLVDLIKRCSICKEQAPVCKICREHKICKKCLYLNTEELLKSSSNCARCLSIIANNCRNCFIYLKPEDKVYKPTCRTHKYCKSCLKVTNTYCKDCNKEVNAIESPPFKLPPKGSQKPNLICVFCNSSPAIRLECRHKVCENCIKACFQQDLYTLISLISACSINDLNIFSPSIRCPVPGCSTKYIMPFNYSWAEPLITQYSLSPAVIEHFSDIFNGVIFTFTYCPRCSVVSGHLANICAYCKY